METRLLAGLDDIGAADWDALHDGRNPFIAHAFLQGLEAHGCLRRQWGWTPRHLTLWEGGRLVAAAPGYLKTNSHGEFVFDHAWAHAYAHHGHDYFPKWLCAVPYSPVTGPRLLAARPELRRALLTAMEALARGEGHSSAHVNFHTGPEDTAFDEGWLSRIDIQYHWRNPGDWRDFDDYLAAFDHKHRKNIRQERARVARAGIGFRIIAGREASDPDLAAAYAFYRQTFREYGNHPALGLGFLSHLARHTGALVLILAEREGVPVAGAICLRGGLARFEPGAQGEHKLARGFLPAIVRSRHWIADPGFREPLRDWCAQETASVRGYLETLSRSSPFKQASGGT